MTKHRHLVPTGQGQQTNKEQEKQRMEIPEVPTVNCPNILCGFIFWDGEFSHCHKCGTPLPNTLITTEKLNLAAADIAIASDKINTGAGSGNHQIAKSVIDQQFGEIITAINARKQYSLPPAGTFIREDIVR